MTCKMWVIEVMPLIFINMASFPLKIYPLLYDNINKRCFMEGESICG